MNQEQPKVRIFIINLKRSVDRREHMTREMEKVGLLYEFIDAVDGKELSKEYVEDVQRNSVAFEYSFGRRLTAGEIGCSLSHARVYQKIVDENVTHSIILEDDVHIMDKNEFNYFLQAFSTHQQPYDYVHLMPSQDARSPLPYLQRYCIFGKYYFSREENSFIAKPLRFTVGAFGYAITHRGAKLLLSQVFPIRMPSDVLTANADHYGVKFGVYSKDLVTLSAQNDTSTIGYVDRPSKMYNNNTLLALMKKTMYSNRYTRCLFDSIKSSYYVVGMLLIKVGLMDYKRHLV